MYQSSVPKRTKLKANQNPGVQNLRSANFMYASSVWNPTGSTSVGLQIEFETVQRKNARYVNSLGSQVQQQ